MFILALEKAEEPEIKLPTSVGSFFSGYFSRVKTKQNKKQNTFKQLKKLIAQTVQFKQLAS